MNIREKDAFMRKLSALPYIMDPLSCKYHPLQFFFFLNTLKIFARIYLSYTQQ